MSMRRTDVYARATRVGMSHDGSRPTHAYVCHILRWLRQEGVTLARLEAGLRPGQRCSVAIADPMPVPLPPWLSSALLPWCAALLARRVPRRLPTASTSAPVAIPTRC